MTIQNKRRPSRPERRGAAIPELAVCIPLLILLTVAAIEACAMIYLKQSATIAAYEGARVALIAGASRTNVIAQCNLILSERRVNGATVTVSPDPAVAPVNTFIAVTVTAPCAPNSPIAGSFFARRSVVGHVEMMKEL
jgi:hypothetical protein